MSRVPATQVLLSDREKEIKTYLEFLKIATERPAVVSAKEGALKLTLSMDLTHTLKASLVLLLYSAMEATLVQLLDEMHEEIGSNCNSADTLNAALLRLVLKTVRSDSSGKILQVGSPLHQSLFSHWISDWQSKTSGKEKRDGSISGSVDGKVFYEQLLMKFGVVPPTPNNLPPSHLTHHALQQVKKNRNELAHGEKSFVDLGQSLAVQSLEVDATNVFATLFQITQEVDAFLDQQRYLAQPPVTMPSSSQTV